MFDQHIGPRLGAAVMSALAQTKRDLSRWYVRYAPGSFGKAAILDGFLNAELRDRPERRRARTRFGATFSVDTQDLIQRYLYLFGTWEPHLTGWLRRRLGPGDVFVDVGANIGYFSVLASKLVGQTGSVVAIEASPAFQDVLTHHARINGCTNVRAVNAAVSDRHEVVTFVLASSRNMGANSIVPYNGPAESSFEIETQTLPEILTRDEITKARVIKIDVEGAEGAVVRGLVPILDQLPPETELTVEVTPERMAELGDSIDELLQALAKHGFHTYRLANDYRPSSYPTALSRGAMAPTRWRGPVTEQSDLVFSRIDAETLP